MRSKQILINVCIIETIVIMILGAFIFELVKDYNNSVVRTEVAKFTSEDEKYCVLINEIGEPIFFGAAEIEVVVQDTDRQRPYLKTNISNDGKSLGEENFDIQWTDNGATLTVRGEEQPDCTYLIIWDNVFKG